MTKFRTRNERTCWKLMNREGSSWQRCDLAVCCLGNLADDLRLPWRPPKEGASSSQQRASPHGLEEGTQHSGKRVYKQLALVLISFSLPPFYNIHSRASLFASFCHRLSFFTAFISIPPQLPFHHSTSKPPPCRPTHFSSASSLPASPPPPPSRTAPPWTALLLLLSQALPMAPLTIRPRPAPVRPAWEVTGPMSTPPPQSTKLSKFPRALATLPRATPISPLS